MTRGALLAHGPTFLALVLSTQERRNRLQVGPRCDQPVLDLFERLGRSKDLDLVCHLGQPAHQVLPVRKVAVQGSQRYAGALSNLWDRKVDGATLFDNFDRGRNDALFDPSPILFSHRRALFVYHRPIIPPVTSH